LKAGTKFLVEIYIGKAENVWIRKRNVSTSMSKSTRHGKNIHDLNAIKDWYLLYILPNAKNALLFVCEQVFICLFEAYRSDVGQPTGKPAHERLVAHIADAKLNLLRRRVSGVAHVTPGPRSLEQPRVLTSRLR
jgi:hypothetical protein